MSKNLLFERTLQDLKDDAERQYDILIRTEIDRLYIGRKISQDEAEEIERELTNCGIDIVDDSNKGAVFGDSTPDKTEIHRNGISYIMFQARNYPLLNANEEWELGRSINDELRLTDSERNDPSPVVKRIIQRAEKAKTKLVLCNVRLVIKLAFHYSIQTGAGPDDLMQYGFLGLIRAREKYDASLGTRFSTYATWWVRQAITRGLEIGDPIIRLPTHIVNDVRNYRRAHRSLGLFANYHPSNIRKIANSLGWDDDYAARIAQLAELKVVSIDAPIESDSGKSIQDLISDDALTPEENAEIHEFNDLIRKSINELGDERLSNIITLRFGIDCPAETLESVGKIYGLTRNVYDN